MGLGLAAKGLEVTEGLVVLINIFRGVVEVNAVLGQEGVDFHWGFVGEEAADFTFGEAVGAVGFYGEGFQRGAGGVRTGGDEAGCEIVRDVERDLHEFRVAEGRAVRAGRDTPPFAGEAGKGWGTQSGCWSGDPLIAGRLR